jgi:hypothetical protein
MLATLLLFWRLLVSILLQSLVSFVHTIYFLSFINCVTYVDADPYIPGGNGAQFYVNQNNLYVPPARELKQLSLIIAVCYSFRSVRNFVIDLRQCVDWLSTPLGLNSNGS